MFSREISDFNAQVIKELLANQNLIEDKERLEDVVYVLQENDGCMSTAGLAFLHLNFIQLIIAYSDSANIRIGDYFRNAVENYNIKVVERFSRLTNFNDFVDEHNVDEECVQWMLNIHEDKTLNDFRECFAINDNNISYSEMLLTCAQIANRKKSYSFKPTVLASDNEFKDYADFIATLPHPLHERFIIEDDHRVCGEIKINAKGIISIILLDSVGASTIYSKSCRTKLATTFPKATIFIPEIKLQHDIKSCSVFALDALFQLYTIAKYLPNKYKHRTAPLHAYLEEHKVRTLKKDKPAEAEIVTCKLPLRMMLNMQTGKLFEEIADRSDEASLAVNKKGETAFAAAKKHFRQDKMDGKTANHRIDDKLKTMYVNNMNYLFANRDNDFHADMKKFTFAAFRQAHDKSKRGHEDDIDSFDDGVPRRKRNKVN